MSEFHSIKFFNSMHPNRGYPITEQKLYSDGTPLIKADIPEAIDSILVRPSNLSEFMTAMFLVDSFNERGVRIKNLVLPYVPGARQDRINLTGDILFTIKSVAQIINARNFDKVVILDPHSAVTPALIDRCDVWDMGMILGDVGGPWDGIIAPDVGGLHRAQRIADLYRLPLFQAFKHRDVSTGRLSGFSVNLSGMEKKHFLVVDDICDGGGTFVGLGEVIRNQICSADLYVSHGIFSKGTDELKKYYREIFVTDSRDIHDRNKITKIDVVSRMMESL